VQRFLGALGLAHLLDDPAFADNAARIKNREALRALIDQRIGADTVEAWIGRLNRAGVPCGRVMDLAEVFADPQVQAQEMVLEIDHPGHGPVRMTGFPIKLSATPARLRHPAPALGEHTDAVLRDLGYDAERIAALKERGIV
jgi:CoA:oxalate CoA-transferase